MSWIINRKPERTIEVLILKAEPHMWYADIVDQSQTVVPMLSRAANCICDTFYRMPDSNKIIFKEDVMILQPNKPSNI